MTFPFHEYEQHKLCALFPAIEGEQLETLKRSIEQNGQIDPCVYIHKDDKTHNPNGQHHLILDGWHRFSICRELGHRPLLERFTPRAHGSTVQLVLAKLAGRHLNEPARAALAARISGFLPKIEGEASAEAGGEAAMSQREAAKAMNVSRSSVQRANVVQRLGSPRVRRAFEKGQVPTTTAERWARHLSEIEQDQHLDAYLDETKAKEDRPKKPQPQWALQPDKDGFYYAWDPENGMHIAAKYPGAPPIHQHVQEPQEASQSLYLPLKLPPPPSATAKAML